MADTHRQQLEDEDLFNSREADPAFVTPCTSETCPSMFIIDRRINRHRMEIEELKAMISTHAKLMEKNSKDTAEVLEIVTLGKGFFKVLGWIGTGIKLIAAIVAPLAAVYLWWKK